MRRGHLGINIKKLKYQLEIEEHTAFILRDVASVVVSDNDVLFIESCARWLFFLEGCLAELTAVDLCEDSSSE